MPPAGKAQVLCSEGSTVYSYIRGNYLEVDTHVHKYI